MDTQDVQLWIYDATNGMAKQLSGAFLGVEIDGVWHTSVVVHGKEHYFMSGIREKLPGTTEFGSPVNVLAFGKTHVSEKEFGAFLRAISDKYTEATYDLFKNNCNHFSNAALQFLVGKEVPAYILDLPKLLESTPAGSFLKALLDKPQTSSSGGFCERDK